MTKQNSDKTEHVEKKLYIILHYYCTYYFTSNLDVVSITGGWPFCVNTSICLRERGIPAQLLTLEEQWLRTSFFYHFLATCLGIG